jgi:heme/copper-type cytochrome/quinol oxidase subunit 3
MDGFYQRRWEKVQMKLLRPRVASDDGVASCIATNVLLHDLIRNMTYLLSASSMTLKAASRSLYSGRYTEINLSFGLGR